MRLIDTAWRFLYNWESLCVPLWRPCDTSATTRILQEGETTHEDLSFLRTALNVPEVFQGTDFRPLVNRSIDHQAKMKDEFR